VERYTFVILISIILIAKNILIRTNHSDDFMFLPYCYKSTSCSAFLIKVLVCLLLLQVLVGDPSVPGTGVVEQQEMELQAPLDHCGGKSDATAPTRAVEFVELVSHSDFFTT